LFFFNFWKLNYLSGNSDLLESETLKEKLNEETKTSKEKLNEETKTLKEKLKL
jgi:hypothetical protein